MYSLALLAVLVPILIIAGIVALVSFFINRGRTVPAGQPDAPSGMLSLKQVTLVLGSFIALYTLITNILGLVFTIIDTKYPPIGNPNYYSTGESISLPVSILIVVLPLFLVLRWLLSKETDEVRNTGLNKWLNYLTMFFAGITVVVDLITALYYYIDGRDLTTAFLLKFFLLLVIAGGVFFYFLSEIRNTLTPAGRMAWRAVAVALVLGSIVWGFSVLGSPRTQRSYKYDEQKINDLMQINNEIQNYYSMKGALPQSVSELNAQSYYIPVDDPQSGKPYEYEKTGDKTYRLCAEFNKDSRDKAKNGSMAYPYRYGASWTHPSGRHCFEQAVNPGMIPAKSLYPY